MLKRNPIILLVEDVLSTTQLITSNLKNEGFDIISAQNGEEAIKLLGSNNVPDLIICDVVMPIMDGFDFRNYLNNDPRYNVIPFIFLTIKDEMNDRIKGTECGADDYLTKPFKVEELIAIVKAKLKRFEIFDYLIKIDRLTGMLNKKALEEKISIELQRTKRYNNPLSIIMFDLDHFKNINDSYGHIEGDLVLKSVAKQILDELREIDFSGRVGGEEFIVVMPETEKNRCTLAANRIRDSISNLVIGENKIKITISGGIASSPDNGTELNDIIYSADKALYTAKNRGRNNVAESPLN